MRYSVFFGLLLALGAGASLLPAQAMAQNARAARAQAEASMVLTGTIDISPAGAVEGFSLRDEDKVEGYLVEFLRRTVAQWRFEPVMHEGRTVAARSPVSLRLMARQTPDQGMEVELRSASFREYDPKATDEVTRGDMPAPRYPQDVFQQGGAGEVLLLMQVARDGSVTDVVAEQVNLHVAGPAKTMQQLRERLAQASIKAARSWTFRPPTTGPYADEPFWTVRTPVIFAIGSRPRERYGRWQAYIPGPKQRAPWTVETMADDASADALPEGGVYMAGIEKGPKLLTPLGG